MRTPAEMAIRLPPILPRDERTVSTALRAIAVPDAPVQPFPQLLRRCPADVVLVVRVRHPGRERRSRRRRQTTKDDGLPHQGRSLAGRRTPHYAARRDLTAQLETAQH